MSYNATFRELLATVFGVTGSVLPVDGALPRAHDGVLYWIKPFVKLSDDRFRRLTLRVMCRCPRCGRELSASRLPQHIHTAACVTRRAALVDAGQIPAETV